MKVTAPALNPKTCHLTILEQLRKKQMFYPQFNPTRNLPGYFKFFHQGAVISLFLLYRKFPVKKVFGRYKVRAKESPGPGKTNRQVKNIKQYKGAYSRT